MTDQPDPHPDAVDVEAASIDPRSPDAPEQIEELLEDADERADHDEAQAG